MKTTKAAVKVLEKTADNPRRMGVNGVWQDSKGRWNAVTEYRAFRWSGDDLGIHRRNCPSDIVELDGLIFGKVNNPDLDYRSIRPYEITTKSIKEAIKSAKLRGMEKDYFINICGTCFNARYVLDALNVVGESCEICVSSKKLQPLFFLAESCEAVLMPVRGYPAHIVYEYPATAENVA